MIPEWAKPLKQSVPEWAKPLSEQPFDPRQFAQEEAARQGVDPDLVMKVIKAESNFDPKAVSQKGATGYMQLMPATAKELGVDPNDPKQNIIGGIRYLKKQLDDFGSPELALAAYNAGPGAVRQAGNKVPNIPETIAYTQKIIGKRPSNVAIHDVYGEPTLDPRDLKQTATNIAFSVPGGLNEIGSGLALPFDVAASLLAGESPLTFNKARRKEYDDQLNAIGVDTNALSYRLPKLTTEIYGTSFVGPALAGGAESIPALSKAPGLINALRSGGMAPGSSVAENALGGYATGYLTAGMLAPESAQNGGMAGAVVAPAAQFVGRGADFLGNYIAQKSQNALAKYAANAPMNETLGRSIGAGYTIPPAAVDPSFKNRTIETLSGGKLATKQLASVKNQEVTDALARKSLGLADDAPLSTESMVAYRKAQYKNGYEPIKKVGSLEAGDEFKSSLDEILAKYTGDGTIPAIENSKVAALVNKHYRQTKFDPVSLSTTTEKSMTSSDALNAIRVLRDDADEAFRAGEYSLGKANRELAAAYENAIERQLAKTGEQDLLQNFRAARVNMAKSHTIENAIKEGGGHVDVRAIGRELQKGEPLTGDLETMGLFGNNFGSNFGQPASQVGSPGVHALQNYLSMIMGSGGLALTEDPKGAAFGLLPYVLPPVGRAAMFRRGAQNALVPKAPMQYSGNALSGLLSDPGLLRIIGRSAPVLAANLE